LQAILVTGTYKSICWSGASFTELTYALA
jgi:hypothetical protein